ncbi:MAG: hypothetical protein WCP22_01995 [Chlamydiota bacterium]
MRPRVPGVAVCVLLTACRLTFSPAPAAAFPASWPQEYLDALADTSKDATPDKVSRDLIAILPEELFLTWDAGGERVLVTTWTDAKYYPVYHKPGDIITVSAAHLIWVAIPDWLKAWVGATAFPADDLALRLKQLNGLPPDADKTWYVEFWAKPTDLFRPSPDPEVTDHEALMDFPDNAYLTIDPAYITWFNDLRAISYTSDTAHPWTRLGYTYDWGNTYNHLGASEFVIRAGAQVEIASMAKTEDTLAVSPTVIDCGRGDRITRVDDHIVISACATLPLAAEPAGAHPAPGTHCDVYILVVSPWGDTMSLLPNGALVEGFHPYSSSLPRSGERLCATLLDYTVQGSFPTGQWKAYVAVLPAGARFIPGHVLTYAVTNVMIE